MSRIGEWLKPDDAFKINGGVCPDCLSNNILYGPCGGSAQNVECGNCHERFNIDGGSIAQRLSKREVPPPLTYSEPVNLFRNGFIVESSRGELIHSCGHGAREKEYKDPFYATVCQIKPVGPNDSYLICDGCSLRIWLPSYVSDLRGISEFLIE